ncbi:hypothetical protein BDV96DRAFT_575636 [Lophiotrema nucula]|uniref:Ent-kaurene synthase n=1 Tax=Lophiotrema nucula TaxID=690887 RepID=A0A6A5Z8A3_9PLEO|nr:hypothetical protein BDV96DRAFT_575636 [Lophiotrema nucula]
MDARLPGRSKPCPRPEEVLELIKEHCGGHDRMMNFSSFSPSLYDTAWLSLVPTEKDPHARLFPQCLEIVLRAQQTDGTWPSYASPTDGILVSLAALLSIATHSARSLLSSEEHRAFTQCIQRGTSGLQKLLHSWDVENAVHVGFELLVTALLRLLEDLAIQFEFPGRAKLMQLYQKKISKTFPELVYGSKGTTLLHSIEAFVDIIEFQRISHHCSEELGIFGSPAATAAYLIHSPKWDPRAESYLRRTVASYGGTENVPSAFPTPLFEVSWTISSMLSPVVEGSSLGNVDLSRVTSFFLETMKQQGSLVGFAPGILEDADTTARNLLMLVRLHRLGYTATVDIAPLVSKFETAECFKTYQLERNPSFSANCNVVLALLELKHQSNGQYVSQIEKALTFLLGLVETGDRDITDKWNISSEYSSMLLVEAMVVALKQYDAGFLQTIPQDLFTDRIPKTLCRIISQVLATQQSDGSWGHSLEVTSYSILGLSHASRLPWGSSIRGYLTDRLSQAKSFLSAEYPRAEKNDYLWIEKTTFQSSLLRMAYCSMALHTTITLERWSNPMAEVFTYVSSQSSTMKKLFTMLPLLEKVPAPLLDLVLVEARFHASNLATGRNSILPRGDLPLSKDKYLGYIPVIWLLCNQINNQTLPAGIIGDMLKLSQLTFQIDEYMETTVAGLSQEQSSLESWIRSECRSTQAAECQNGTEHFGTFENGDGNELNIDGFKGDDAQSPSRNNHLSTLSSVQIALRKFIRYILRHKAVLRSSPLTQRFLATELSEFLLAHMRQNSDNVWLKICKSDSAQAGLPQHRPSYFSWARSTGADHTSCPFSFRFFMCLISKPDRVHSCFESAQAQYFSSSVTRHLATMCRQYNDYGSIMRDAEENNLNSVDFAEFQAGAWEGESMKRDLVHDEPLSGEKSLWTGGLRSARESLMAIAEFERKLMELSFRALKEVVSSPEAIGGLKVLIDVTDLFGQLYVAKDIASRKRKAENLDGVEG